MAVGIGGLRGHCRGRRKGCDCDRDGNRDGQRDTLAHGIVLEWSSKREGRQEAGRGNPASMNGLSVTSLPRIAQLSIPVAQRHTPVWSAIYQGRAYDLERSFSAFTLKMHRMRLFVAGPAAFGFCGKPAGGQGPGLIATIQTTPFVA
jgi:hypothetical protein